MSGLLKFLIGGDLPVLPNDIWLMLERNYLTRADLFYMSFRPTFLTERLMSNVYLSSVAARNGYLNLLQWLVLSKFKINKRAWQEAAKSGQIEVLQWAKDVIDEVVIDEELFAFAAAFGHLELLQWLKSIGCPCDTNACMAATAGGFWEVLKWLRANGCPWDEMTCLAASGESSVFVQLGWQFFKFKGTPGGSFAVLEWAQANGCPWDEWTFAGAASCGDLNLMKWLKAKGCPWDVYACAGVALGRENLIT